MKPQPQLPKRDLDTNKLTAILIAAIALLLLITTITAP
jgi:hypothetical protein